MLEIEKFTQWRAEHLTKVPSLMHLECWGNYCYLPLDLPRYDYPEVVKWFFERCKTNQKIAPDVASDKYGVNMFDTVDVLPNGGPNRSQVWTINLQNDFIDLFPDFYQRLLSEFPFKKIHYMKFWSCVKVVPWHRDPTKFIDFPGAFRILLHDENPTSTMRLKDSLPDQNLDDEPEFVLPRLKETNCFVWNNLRTQHSSDFDPKYRKVLLIIDSFDLDIQRYQILIKNSIEKFKNYSMISSRNKSDYIKLKTGENK
jgi:hypothetical protein